MASASARAPSAKPITVNGVERPGSPVLYALFFTVHYGIFCVVHGVFTGIIAWKIGFEASFAFLGLPVVLLLGIVLAHADLVAEASGRRPILLLDEVAAHLDPLRRAALFDRLAAAGGQVWMTGTEAALFDGIGAAATRLTVSGGAVMEGG